MIPHNLLPLMRFELAQRREEGGDTTALEPLLAAAEALPEASAGPAAEALWRLVESLPVAADPAEPSDLAEIRALRPDGPRALPHGLSPAALYDRLHGALLGRVAGCQLGKPVEGWQKSDIDAYLVAAGEAEIRDYLPWLDPVPDHLPRKPSYRACCRGHLHGALRDDDQDYTLLGLLILEEHGPDFTPGQVAQSWLKLLPWLQVYTAERAAYRNLVSGYAPPESATWRNPYREWIGAQIRADGWAYASVGRLERAAEYAWRDATVSHVRNGIYGEMYFAAVIAAAFTTDSPAEALRLGLTEIPADCRLARCLHDVFAWRETEPTWQGCWERINERYGHYHGVHTINNAALVALGLLYGDGDLGATIGIAVHGGWDTDCNGATAGSVLGAILGAEALPARWTVPLDDQMESALFGHAHHRLSDLAALAARLNG